MKDLLPVIIVIFLVIFIITALKPVENTISFPDMPQLRAEMAHQIGFEAIKEVNLLPDTKPLLQLEDLQEPLIEEYGGIRYKVYPDGLMEPCPK